MAGPIHYEVFQRKTPPSSWTLVMATEDRKQAVETAETLLADKQAVAVRVIKETLDIETMSFQSTTLFTRGAPEVSKRRKLGPETVGPRCSAPSDLYTPSARETLSRVLEDWLKRNGVTAFELLHRPDLVEQLEASGVELQHALQKVAIPESQETGRASHDLIRHYQRLSAQAMERVIKAGRTRLFSDFAGRPLAETAQKIAGLPDRAFIMGGVVAAAVVGLKGPRERLEGLMDLAGAAPPKGPPRALVMVQIEQLLCELLASRVSLAEILGPGLDQGGSLAAVVRMVAPREIESLVKHHPRFALAMPVVEGPAARLGTYLGAGEYPILASSLARMVLRELMGPRRLRPADASAEIDILRVLAMSLTATVGRLLTLEEVQNAFVERSRNIVTADFVSAYVAQCETVLCEAEQLARLCENVTGAANKRAAARWMAACVSSLRLESEMRNSRIPPVEKLAALANLQRAVKACELGENDESVICNAIGTVGSVIEAEAKLIAKIVRANVPIPRRLAMLLRLAAGETGPTGPAADRAKAEALKLFRAPEARAALHAEPQSVMAIKGLMQAAGLAA